MSTGPIIAARSILLVQLIKRFCLTNRSFHHPHNNLCGSERTQAVNTFDNLFTPSRCVTQYETSFSNNLFTPSRCVTQYEKELFQFCYVKLEWHHQIEECVTSYSFVSLFLNCPNLKISVFKFVLCFRNRNKCFKCFKIWSS